MAGEQPEKTLSSDDLWKAAQKGRADAAVADAGDDRPAGNTQATPGAEAPGNASGGPGNAGGEPDPLQGLPEQTRKLLQGLDLKVRHQDEETKRIRQQLATAHGTIGNLKQRLDASQAMIGRITPTVDAVEAQKKADLDAARAAKEEKRKELREKLTDFPEFVEYLDMELADVKPVTAKESAVATQGNGTQQAGGNGQQQPANQGTELPQDREARLIAERELSDEHPKWKATVNSKEFLDFAYAGGPPDDERAALAKLHEANPDEAAKYYAQYARKYPQWYQKYGRLVMSNDVSDASAVLTAFKKHIDDSAQVAEVEADRQARLNRGESVTGRGSTGNTDATSDNALWEQAKRDRAKLREQARAP